MNVAAIICKMGAGGAPPITQKHCNFYMSLSEKVCAQKGVFVQEPPLSPLVISNDSANKDAGNIVNEFRRAATKIAASFDVLVIDLDIPEMADLRGAVHLNMWMGVIAAIEALNDQLKKLICLVHDMPDKKSAGFRIIHSYVESGVLVLINDRGEVVSNDSISAEFNKVGYRVSLADIRGKSIDLLSQRLIKQRGHFHRDLGQGGKECVGIFFDGKLCSRELRELIRDYITQTCGTTSSHILYDPAYSKWIDGPLNLLAADMNIPCHSILDITSQPSLIDNSKNTVYILIMQLIDTGKTVTRLFEQLQPIITQEPLHCLAVLSTAGDSAQFGKRNIAGRPIDYLLKVVQERYLTGQCPMCSLHLPYTNEGVEDTLMLSAFQFWHMVDGGSYSSVIDGSGLKAEDDPPPRECRSPIPFVPDFPKMLEENGAWLSAKIGDLLTNATDKKLNDIVVVCPDQKGSQVLVEYLRIVSGVTVIRIDPAELKNIIKGNNLDELVSCWEVSRPEWYVQLQSASREVVVMDEFSVSGRTRSVLHQLLLRLGKDIMCDFSLAEFGPDVASNARISTISLYEWKLHIDA